MHTIQHTSCHHCSSSLTDQDQGLCCAKTALTIMHTSATCCAVQEPSMAWVQPVVGPGGGREGEAKLLQAKTQAAG